MNVGGAVGNDGSEGVPNRGTIVVASDHAGLPLKNELVPYLAELGFTVEDLGTHDPSSVDYPDYAHGVAKAILEGKHPLGVLLCGSGIGMSIAANRHPGIRAVVCSEPYSAAMARRHNAANVLCMGARVVGGGLARDILEAFVEQTFEGGRHQKRVEKIEVTA